MGFGSKLDWAQPVIILFLGRVRKPHSVACLIPRIDVNIAKAIETVLLEGPRTRDIGGNAATSEVGQALAEAI